MQRNQKILQDLRCKVVLISFGPQNGALRWKNDTGAIFDLYTDEHRTLYSAFHLERSFFKVWSIAPLFHYGIEMAKGAELIATYKDVKDDPHQMGGDFVLSKSHNKEWRLTMIHRSKTSADRPSLSTILNHLCENNKQASSQQ